MAPTLSLVIPLFNEEQSLPELIGKLEAVLPARGHEFEVLAIDDGSTDASLEVLKKLRADRSILYSNVVLIFLVG